MHKKVCKKCWQKACEMVIYTSSQREILKRERKESRKGESEKVWKKSQKTFKKVLTKEKECDILFELSSREGEQLDLEN